MTDPPSIGSLLRDLRRGARLTQAELAARLRCTQRRITNIELGVRRPSLDLLHEWAGACGRTYVFDFPASSAEGVGVLARAAAAPLPVREIIDEILSVERPSEASLQALQAHVRAWRQQARGVGTA